MSHKQWKFRQDVKVMPGIYIKYGNGGIKTSFNETEDSKYEIAKLRNILLKPYDAADEIKSKHSSILTSKGLEQFKQLLLDSNNETLEINKLISFKRELHLVKLKELYRKRNSLFKFLFKKKILSLENDVELLDLEIKELLEQLELADLSIEIDADETFNELHQLVYRSFNILSTSEKKWDLTSSKTTNQFRERTSATNTITRTEIDISLQPLSIVSTSGTPIRFKNINGGDLYFYPGFLIFHESKTDFAVIDYVDLDVTFLPQNFIEEEKVPTDTIITSRTWKKVNKDGSPDRRFVNNYQIPVVKYGELHFSTKSGLNEKYAFSNYDATELFSKALTDYILALRTANNLISQFGKHE